MNSRHFVSGVFLIDAVAAGLNNAGVDDASVLRVKKCWRDGRAYPLISGQAFRRWQRDTIAKVPELNKLAGPASPITVLTASAGKSQIVTEGEPFRYWDDDLMGYMRAEKKQPGKTKAEVISRTSPYLVSNLVSLPGGGITTDWGAMSRGDSTHTHIYQSEIYMAHLKGMISLSLAQAGTFSYNGGPGWHNLSQEMVKIYDRSSDLTFMDKGGDGNNTLPVYRMTTDARLKRIEALFRSFYQLEGGARQATNYCDVVPSVMIWGVHPGGNNILSQAMAVLEENEGPVFQADLVESRLSKLVSKLYVGWLPGYLHGQRIKVIEFADQFDQVVCGELEPVILSFLDELKQNTLWLE